MSKNDENKRKSKNIDVADDDEPIGNKKRPKLSSDARSTVGQKQNRLRFLSSSSDDEDDVTGGNSSSNIDQTTTPQQKRAKMALEKEKRRSTSDGASSSTRIIDSIEQNRNGNNINTSNNGDNAARPSPSSTTTAATPDWLALQFAELTEQAIVRQSRVDGILAATSIVSFSDMTNNQDRSIPRHEKALRLSDKGLLAEMNRFMEKVSSELGFEPPASDEEGDDDDEDDDDEEEKEENADGSSTAKKTPRRSGKRNVGSNIVDDSPASPAMVEQQPYEEAERALATFGNDEFCYATFGGKKFRLARSKEEYDKFTMEMKEKFSSFVNDHDRRRLIESRNEISIYKAIASLHRWLVFCCISSISPDQELTPDDLGNFRDWMMNLSPNSEKHYADGNRFGTSLQLEHVGAEMARVLFMYKMMGMVDVGIGLRMFMGGRKDYEIFGRWAKMQLGCKTPFDRCAIYPDEIDFFIENLDLGNDAEFQAALYLLIMVATGARTSSLLETKDTMHRGLLVDDVKFDLISDGRVSANVSLQHEKQASDIDHNRIVAIEDRLFGMSCSMMLFAWFVRLSVFKNSARDMLDASCNYGSANRRFEIKDVCKEMAVFRRPINATANAAESQPGRVTANALTNDDYVFDLFCRTLRLPRRGFSSRSVRQGVAMKVISDDVVKGGTFNRTSVVEQLKGTNIWTSKACLRYVKAFAKECYNPSAVMYDSIIVNPHGQSTKIRLPIHGVRYRLLDEEYLTPDDERVRQFVTSLEEVRVLRDKVDKLAEKMGELNELIAIEAKKPQKRSKKPQKRSKKQIRDDAGIDDASYTSLNKQMIDGERSYKDLLRTRLEQYTDHINYQTLKRRMQSKSNERPVNITGKSFDFRALCLALEEFDKKDGLWVYTFYKTPDDIPNSGAVCIVKGCSSLVKSGNEMRTHLASEHGVQEVSAKRSKTIQQIGSRSTNNKQNVEETAKDDVELGEDEADESSTTSVGGIRFLCKATEKCSTKAGFARISSLHTHFGKCHWAAWKCQSCENVYSEEDFVESDHQNHDVQPIASNFGYFRFLETKCVKCDSLTMEQNFSNVLCIRQLPMVVSALDANFVRSLFNVVRMIRGDLENVDASLVLETKRKLVYNELKHRLYGGRTDVVLPSCVTKEVKKRFWHPSLPREDSTVLSQET